MKNVLFGVAAVAWFGVALFIASAIWDLWHNDSAPLLATFGLTLFAVGALTGLGIGMWHGVSGSKS